MSQPSLQPAMSDQLPALDRASVWVTATSTDFWRHKAVWAVLILVYLVGLGVAHNVVAPGQFPGLLRQAAPLACLALGQTILVIGRGLDLSVGGMVGLVNVVAAGHLAQQIGGWPTMLLCLGLGVLVGLINGLGVVFAGVSPFIMTLGMSFFLSGAALVYTGGAPSGELPSAIRSLSEHRVAAIPVDAYIVAALFVVVALVLRKSWQGRWIYARGINPEAAKVGGVSLSSVDIVSYTFSGGCAALGGLFLAGNVGQGSLGAGEDLLLNSLAAVVVGGTTFVGGKGGVGGTLGGVLLFTLLTSVLTAAHLAAGGISIASGLVLLAAATLFRTSRRST